MASSAGRGFRPFAQTMQIVSELEAAAKVFGFWMERA